MAPIAPHLTTTQITSKLSLFARQYDDSADKANNTSQHHFNRYAIIAIVLGPILCVVGLAFGIWIRIRRENGMEKEIERRVEKNALLDKKEENAAEFRKAELDGNGPKRDGEELEGKPVEVKLVTNQVLELDGGEAGREMECRPVPGSVRDV
jgi:hypothetical protein